MTAAEVATYLGGHVPASKITKAYRDGNLVATRIGRSTYFTQADVDAWLYAWRTTALSGISTQRAPTTAKAVGRERTR